MREDPELSSNVGRHDLDDRWTDWSKAARERRAAALAARLAEVVKLSGRTLAGQDLLSARLLEYDLRVKQQAEDATIHLLRFGQLYGFHNRVYSLVDRMPARTVHDYENIIARLRALPVYVDQNLSILDESIAKGMTQAQPVVEIVAKQIAAQIQQSTEETALLAAFRKFPANIPVSEQTRLRVAATDAYERQFIPSWRKLLTYVQATYAPKARAADGVSSIPGGHETYAALIKLATTTGMTAREIHDLGLKEVDRLEGEMKAILSEAKFTGTIAEFEANMNAMPEQHFHSREEMLVYCRNVAKIVEPELPKMFKRIPVLLYGIRAIPPDREAASASNAQPPTPDYSSPGWFNLNAYEPEKQVKYNKESLVLHEAVPGHIFQITFAQALPGIPELRKFYSNSAYVEGWALYVESLGSELGVYRDPYSRFGRLASERFRAVRLVVDTGLHEFGWTREKARAYFSMHAPDASLAEVDRYISWPGQALSYKLGQLKIRQLRELAEKQLGARFDIREFHDVVLRNGTLPLELLDEQVRAYLTAGASK